MHAMLLPRLRDQESYERLDALLGQVGERKSEPRETAQLISEHVGGLVAGIEQMPRLDARALLDATPAGMIRWLELTLNTELDRMLADFNAADSKCADCTRAWVQHLLAARQVVARWAWARETELSL